MRRIYSALKENAPIHHWDGTRTEPMNEDWSSSKWSGGPIHLDRPSFKKTGKQIVLVQDFYTMLKREGPDAKNCTASCGNCFVKQRAPK